MDANRFRRLRTSLRKLVSAVTAFAMIAVGLVAVPVIAQVAGAQPAAAGTYSPYAYIADNSANTVTVIRLSDNSTVTTIPVGTAPRGVAITPDGSKVYVANSGSASVSVISTGTNTVTKTITVGSSPWGMTLTPDGTKLYVTNNGAGTVTVVATASDAVQNTVTVGSNPAGLAATPDGTKVYVTNNGASTVSVISTSNNTVSATVTVAAGPRVAAISPDGTTAYIASTGVNTVTPITVSTNAAGAGIASPGGPYGGAIVPDQAPTAVLASVVTGEAMTPIAFDASASSDTSGTIASYAWDFGDGSSVVTTGAPTTTHTYAVDGTYTASVTLTDTLGTTNTLVFTGQTVMRNGSAAARATRSVTVLTPFSLVTAPGGVNFAGAITGKNQVLSATLPLAVSNGNAAGWNLSVTSTQWTTGGASPKVLPLTATTVTNTPIVACDTAGACNLASNAIGVPYVLPAGATAPTATKLFNASAGTGIGRQAVTPTLKLNVPSNARAGTYHSTVTVTLSSGP